MFYFFFEENYIIVDSAFPGASGRREPGEPSPYLRSASRFLPSVFSEKTKGPPQNL